MVKPHQMNKKIARLEQMIVEGKENSEQTSIRLSPRDMLLVYREAKRTNSTATKVIERGIRSIEEFKNQEFQSTMDLLREYKSAGLYVAWNCTSLPDEFSNDALMRQTANHVARGLNIVYIYPSEECLAYFSSIKHGNNIRENEWMKSNNFGSEYEKCIEKIRMLANEAPTKDSCHMSVLNEKRDRVVKAIPASGSWMILPKSSFALILVPDFKADSVTHHCFCKIEENDYYRERLGKIERIAPAYKRINECRYGLSRLYNEYEKTIEGYSFQQVPWRPPSSALGNYPSTLLHEG